MKSAIYMERGRTQLILTPECDWEKSVVDALYDGDRTINVERGEFYLCNGGWVRQGGGQRSVIVSITMKEKILTEVV